MKNRKTPRTIPPSVLSAEMDQWYLAAQRRRAEGAQFRKVVLDLAPFQINEYLFSHTIDAFWLLGFGGLGKGDQTMSSRSKRPRPGARGPRTWKADVHKAARVCFRIWEKDPARYLSWQEFSAACLTEIERKTGTRVPAASLRRSILPTKDFRRPK